MEERLYVTRREVRRPRGGSYAIIECPFCGCETEARLWSLASSGKRCSGCGAVHSDRGHRSRSLDRPGEGSALR